MQWNCHRCLACDKLLAWMAKCIWVWNKNKATEPALLLCLGHCTPGVQGSSRASLSTLLRVPWGASPSCSCCRSLHLCVSRAGILLAKYCFGPALGALIQFEFCTKWGQNDFHRYQARLKEHSYVTKVLVKQVPKWCKDLYVDFIHFRTAISFNLDFLS